MNIEIKISKKPILYQAAIDFLEERVLNIQMNKERELIWILEHEDIYTCGTSGKDIELLDKNFFLLPKQTEVENGRITAKGRKSFILF